MKQDEPSLTRHQVPYEFLVRWQPNGEVGGAQIQWRRMVIDETGAVYADTVMDAAPVSRGADEGYPLADVLPLIHIGSLRAMETATARALTAEAQLQSATDEIARLKTELTAAQAAIVAMSRRE